MLMLPGKALRKPYKSQIVFMRVKNVREKLKELLDRKRSCLPWKEEKVEVTPLTSSSRLQQQEPLQEGAATSQKGRRKKASQKPGVSAMSAPRKSRTNDENSSIERSVMSAMRQ